MDDGSEWTGLSPKLQNVENERGSDREVWKGVTVRAPQLKRIGFIIQDSFSKARRVLVQIEQSTMWWHGGGGSGGLFRR